MVLVDDTGSNMGWLTLGHTSCCGAMPLLPVAHRSGNTQNGGGWGLQVQSYLNVLKKYFAKSIKHCVSVIITVNICRAGLLLYPGQCQTSLVRLMDIVM